MGTCGCGATQVVTVSLARRTLTSCPVWAFQMKMDPPSEPEHTKSLCSPIRDTCRASIPCLCLEGVPKLPLDRTAGAQPARQDPKAATDATSHADVQFLLMPDILTA